MWGRGPESRREGSTLETGGLPPPGGPLWYPLAPEKKKGGKCKRNKKYVSGVQYTLTAPQGDEMCVFDLNAHKS